MPGGGGWGRGGDPGASWESIGEHKKSCARGGNI